MNTNPNMDKKTISIIVPCMNEEDVIESFYEEFLKHVSKIANIDYELILIDDGSTDTTLEKFQELNKKDNKVKYISFSRNFGKEAAMLAGFKKATGNYITIMDVDLQDPPYLLPQMVALLEEGKCDCVATRRKDRKGEPIIRSFFAKIFYKIINSLSPMQMKEGARDYRLITREVLNSILSLDECNRFTKGFYEWVGYKTEWIEYDNLDREKGETKWNFFGLLLYSFNAITSFSSKPLLISSLIGMFFCTFSVIAILVLSIRHIFYPYSAYGWTSMMSVMFFLAGLQLFCLGIIGEYISKIYTESKKRPHFIIKKSSKN